MRRLLLAIGLAAALLPARSHHAAHPADGIGFDQHLGAPLPLTLRFTDDSRRTLTLGDEFGKTPVLLVLGYAGCRDLCPTTLTGVAEALRRSGLAPGRDYRAVFASIDPREDATILARARAERLDVIDAGGWRFLAGDARSSDALARSVGFRYRFEAERDAFAHPAGFVIATPQGMISRYFFGVRFDPADLRLAMAEAGQGRTGRLADRLLLLCYHFDPATGRYSLAILDLLRAAIAAFLLAAGFWAWRQRRSRRALEPRA
jgi:protein SCO1/2